MLYETVEMVYACMDFAGGMRNGILECVGYHNPARSAHYPLIFFLVSIPPFTSPPHDLSRNTCLASFKYKNLHCSDTISAVEHSSQSVSS